MTIEDTRSVEPNVGRILRNAFRKAQLISEHQNLSQVQFREGLEQLQNICHQLESEGVYARSVDHHDILCVVDQADYTLPTSVIDGVGTPIYVPEGENVDEPSGATHMRLVRRDEWLKLSAKDQSSSTPVMIFVDRSGESVVARVWQKPDEAGTIRLPVHRLRADVTMAQSTVDFERFWVMFFEYAVAHEVSGMGSMTLAERQYLWGQRDYYLRQAKAPAGEKPSRHMVMGHRSGRC